MQTKPLKMHEAKTQGRPEKSTMVMEGERNILGAM